MKAENDLERLKARMRAGAALAAPEVREIRPEIRSAGLWHITDTAAAGGPAGPAGQDIAKGIDEGFLLGMMVREVRFRVAPEKADAFHAWLRRHEPDLRTLAAREGVLYRGTYGAFGRLGSYVTLWGYSSFEAIQKFSIAVARLDTPLGERLREMQDYVDLRDPAHYEEQLLLPAAAGRSLSPAGDPAPAPGKRAPRRTGRG